MTQQELADRAGITARHVRDLEAGRTSRPRPSTLRLLARALGLDGVDLEHFHQTAANGLVSALLVREGSDGPAAGRLAIRQLPATTSFLAGRRDELRRLDTDEGAGIWVISGTAGVGKTTLALHWAHRATARFPDGQIHLDLCGFSPHRSPARPAETLPVMLRILQVPVDSLPAKLDAQIALYRSMVADRRMIIVLDNVRDAEQVRPLLPGVPGCIVVITSRNELTSLTVREGARPLPLTLLTVDEAREMLSDRVGSGRVTAELGAVDEVIARCAGLPLALAIMAARAAARPQFSLQALVRDSGAAHAGLDAFDGGDPSTQVRAVFSWSYRTLTGGAARLFRLLGLHPGPDVTGEAAASLAGTSAAQAREWLAELAGAHLMSEHAVGRYGFHDLLRAYAADLVRTQDDEGECRAAVHRMLDHYLHSAYAAQLRFAAHRDTIAPDPPIAGVDPERPAHDVGALAWFDAERPVLLGVVAQAARLGFATHAWQLAWMLTEYVGRRGYGHDWMTANRTALDALQGGNDLDGQAHAHRGLALGYARLDSYDDACRHFECSLELFRRHGDQVGQGHVQLGLAWVKARRGRNTDALEHAGQALTFYRQAGHEPGQADALNAVGWYHALLGDHHEALTHCEQAIALHQRSANRRGEASTWDSLGYAHHHLGDQERAVECCRNAVELYRQCGDRYNEAVALDHLGDALAPAAPAAALDAWRCGLALLDELGNRDADRLRAKLTDFSADSPPKTL